MECTLGQCKSWHPWHHRFRDCQWAVFLVLWWWFWRMTWLTVVNLVRTIEDSPDTLACWHILPVPPKLPSKENVVSLYWLPVIMLWRSTCHVTLSTLPFWMYILFWPCVLMLWDKALWRDEGWNAMRKHSIHFHLIVAVYNVMLML